ncbi:uncharacterized protein LOC124888924 [Capsicum annuum]|uniref:uncharacterized protein LOC124888924 n=1 Tax=Capsicum annuum TaxID=4072 RepID=UPI001FB15E92|nr:uncharacterized protein LOC124888924 [Capsicum annuum]
MAVGVNGRIGSCLQGLRLRLILEGGEEERARVGMRYRSGVSDGSVRGGRGRREVVEVRRVSGRLISIKLVIGGFTLHVGSVYAPQAGLDKDVKVTFWENFDEEVRSVPNSEKIVLAGDFNGHIGVLSGGYDDVYGGFVFGDRNGERSALLDFMRTFGLGVVKSSFLKKEDHLITF